MKSECGLSTPALLAGIGDVRIRQRMEACQQGIIQLDSLRQKHTRLMEQLRSQYPDFATPPTRSTSTTTTTIENLHAHYSKTLPPITESPPTQHRYESTTLPQPSSSSSFINSSTSTSPPSTSLPTAMNAAFATRCESPISACMSSHRSSVSIDSGYTSISSDPFLSTISATPMSYSAFRKKASTLERPPHTSTTTTTESPTTCTNQTSQQQQQQQKVDEDEKEIESTSEKMIETTIESTTGTAPMRQNRFGRKQREDSSWQRPRSMFAMISTSTSNNKNNNNEEEEKNNVGGDNIKDKEKESFANVSVASTARKLLDTSTFSQITPPPMSRKFATLQKTPVSFLTQNFY
uniref:Uncharacterized protein n=1 Tax=Panagrolaimus davidi TaxID=227884 RepID=A0A914QBD1_9BILA